MRAAVLGSPIGHSRSPALHQAAYEALGLGDWSYEAISVPAGELAEFVTMLGPEWAGLSLTMPLKSEALTLPREVVRVIDPLVLQTASANTLLLHPASGGGEPGSLHNTDVEGIVRAVQAAASPSVASTGTGDAASMPAASASTAFGSFGSAAIVGAGATARSAVAALLDLQVDRVRILARNPDRAEAVSSLARELGLTPTVAPLDAAQPLTESVVISTVPAGAMDILTGLVPAEPGVLLDVVYDPWPTAFASAWATAGGTVVPGLEMLIEQAGRQVELMTGRQAPLAAMRAAVTVGEEPGQKG